MKRIFAAGIHQESNTFNPVFTRYDDFKIISSNDFQKIPCIRALKENENEVICSFLANAIPGGVMLIKDFLRLVDELLEPLINDPKKFDGVYLILHGALQVEYIGSGEAYIVSRIRDIVSWDVPIAVPLDMHGNIAPSLAKLCNIICGYRTAPHTDIIETRIRVAKLLLKAINEKVLPKVLVFRIPIMMPGEKMMTDSGIGREVIDFLPKIERDHHVWCASYFAGMPWIDSINTGASIVITGVGDLNHGINKAYELASFVWENRESFEFQGIAMEPDEAIEFVKTHFRERLVILADSADNVTAGAAGDNAFTLSLFIKNKIKSTLFAAIIDPEVVKYCESKKVGDKIDIELGGKFDKTSQKCKLKGALLKNLTLELELPKPKSCVLSYKGIDILVFSKRAPVFTEETLIEHGLLIKNYNILVVKQGYLSPEFERIKKHSVLALTPGNCDQRLERLKYTKIKRPMWPISNETPK